MKRHNKYLPAHLFRAVSKNVVNSEKALFFTTVIGQWGNWKNFNEFISDCVILKSAFLKCLKLL